jgi:CRP/FNR family cyclic AMP-dependent transcriptional regulator
MTSNVKGGYNTPVHFHEIEIFQDLSPEEIEEIGRRAPMKRVEAGTIFYSPDQATEVLFILKEGQVKIYHLSPDGRAFTNAILDAGAVFGEMTLLGQELYGSYAESVTPCLLCLMSREDVKRFLLSDPRIASRITEMLGRRLIEADRRLSDFAFKNLHQHLATILLQLAQEPRGLLFRSGYPEVPYTHEVLAEMTGTYRETVTKILNDFRSQGLIELRRGKILLLDSKGLREHTEN